MGALDSCYALNTGVWNFIGTLFEAAYRSASVSLKDGTLWLSGGVGLDEEPISACETINSAGGIDPFQVELPIPLAAHCTAMVADWTIAIVGGYTTNETLSDRVWLFDIETKIYTEIASLSAPRTGHVCQVVDKGIK